MAALKFKRYHNNPSLEPIFKGKPFDLVKGEVQRKIISTGKEKIEIEFAEDKYSGISEKKLNINLSGIKAVLEEHKNVNHPELIPIYVNLIKLAIEKKDPSLFYNIAREMRNMLEHNETFPGNYEGHKQLLRNVMDQLIELKDKKLIILK
ncbi:MAG: hypothetical protein V1824_03230 [archaeon]